MKPDNTNNNLFDIEKLTDSYLEDVELFGDINFKTFCEYLEWTIPFLKVDIINDRVELVEIFNSVIDEIIKKLENEKM